MKKNETKNKFKKIIDYFKDNDVRVRKLPTSDKNIIAYKFVRSGFYSHLTKITTKSGSRYNWHIRDTSTQKIIAKGTSLSKFKTTSETVFF